MKLRNKKTGEIREIKEILIDGMFNVNSLAELNEEWEDYEEPKEFWYIEADGKIRIIDKNDSIIDSSIKRAKEIGNYFETEEEAEKAVEKLKAWKRLKDKGFRFRGLGVDHYEIDDIKYEMEEPPTSRDCQEMKDLKLLFGGEE